MVEPAVVLRLLGIPDAASDSSLRLTPTVFSPAPASLIDPAILAGSVVVALRPSTDEPLSRLLAFDDDSPGEGSRLDVAELATLGARSACEGLDAATRC